MTFNWLFDLITGTVEDRQLLETATILVLSWIDKVKGNNLKNELWSHQSEQYIKHNE